MCSVQPETPSADGEVFVCPQGLPLSAPGSAAIALPARASARLAIGSRRRVSQAWLTGSTPFDSMRLSYRQKAPDLE